MSPTQRRAESPIANGGGSQHQERFTDTMLEQGSNAELQLQLKKKEQELEHKLNTLIALNEKLQVFNDIKKDLAENKQIVRQSEDARGKLQVTITQTAQKLKEDTEMKEKFQESLQSKINELMQEIQ